jgi:hypothetical protein
VCVCVCVCVCFLSDLLGGDFNAEVTACDHDTVRDGENVVKVANTLVVLNLRDDLDVLARFTQALADLEDILPLADERRKHHVDTVLHAELKVLLVLLRQGGEVDVDVREIHTLLGSEHPIVLQRVVAKSCEL